ncbi:hypothetical protein ACFL4D_01720 [Candidatus Margulisiibacteriota bacterium]
MKKILTVVFLLIMVFSVNSFALFSVGVLGGSYSMGGSSVTAIGLEASVPFSIIPLMKTNIQVLTGTYNDASFMPVMVQQSISIPFAGVYGGLEAGYISATVSGQSAGVITYGGFVGYEMPLGMAKAFGEVSYDIIPLSQISSSADDESVLVLKAGARIGL